MGKGLIQQFCVRKLVLSRFLWSYLGFAEFVFVLNCFSIICLAGAVSIALGSDWSELSEEIGLWIPVEIVNNEQVGNPKSEEELGNYLLDCQFSVLIIFVSFNINELVSISISEKLTSLEFISVLRGRNPPRQKATSWMQCRTSHWLWWRCCEMGPYPP